MASDYKIVLQDVGKTFGTNAVLDGVNLEIERGESMAIIGQ
jgi:phospholipid/cholesterol/gamma-HCH transport system ATP-binding protein